MIIKCYNETHPYLLFIDIEFNNKTLVQFAGLLFTRIDSDGTYQLKSSCNHYVTTKVCYPFMEYTSITNTFLEQNGISLSDLRENVFEFLKDIDLKDVLLISHGLKNDRIILQSNNLEMSYITSNNTKRPIDGYCTFNNAKRILGREKHLSVSDLCEECGYYLHHAHNAFNDVWAEVAIFTYLRKIEEQQRLEALECLNKKGDKE